MNEAPAGFSVCGGEMRRRHEASRSPPRWYYLKSNNDHGHDYTLIGITLVAITPFWDPIPTWWDTLEK